jgi:hypothetical protein
MEAATLSCNVPQVQLAQPRGRLQLLVHVEPGNKVLVTRQHDHDDQTADQYDVDEAEHREHQIGLPPWRRSV